MKSWKSHFDSLDFQLLSTINVVSEWKSKHLLKVTCTVETMLLSNWCLLRVVPIFITFSFYRPIQNCRVSQKFVWGFWKKLFGGFRRIHNGVLQLIRNSFWIFGKKIIVDRKMIHERACYGYVLFLWSFFEVFFGYYVFISNHKLFYVNSALPISNPSFEAFDVDTFRLWLKRTNCSSCKCWLTEVSTDFGEHFMASVDKFCALISLNYSADVFLVEFWVTLVRITGWLLSILQ